MGGVLLAFLSLVFNIVNAQETKRLKRVQEEYTQKNLTEMETAKLTLKPAGKNKIALKNIGEGTATNIKLSKISGSGEFNIATKLPDFLYGGDEKILSCLIINEVELELVWDDNTKQGNTRTFDF